MRVRTLFWDGRDERALAALSMLRPDLVLYFGERHRLSSPEVFQALRTACPDAIVFGCSTGGQFLDAEVVDDDIACLAIRFERTRLRLAQAEIRSPGTSRAAGTMLAQTLRADDLKGIFVLSDGLNVNGSELVAGFTDILGSGIPVTGGLAGDGPSFGATLVGADAAPRSHVAAAVGFYGDAIQIGHGSAGGWNVFGPVRRITRSLGNVLFELDGEPALDLYQRYLGPEAEGLPGSGLLFPLQVYDAANPDHKIVRTILAVDREQGSLTFAGDVPTGWRAQLMRGHFSRLAEGAAEAASQAVAGAVHEPVEGDGVALMVSCIGRRLLMGQRISDEVDAAASTLGPGYKKLGFYAYGEIAPHATSRQCELHNQTMTITTLRETAGNQR
ncbi:FIST signal transduction protein [uncultured Alsobacter sp.]|uniref:FIST signal transduction protein n=1 Tax=uncultured Alsobacter sp. TaxID=1748258 RepID=UPI0025E4CACF|nr:FIST N-terminal domain-containing protein [uncultured Alsobacter sp.]